MTNGIKKYIPTFGTDDLQTKCNKNPEIGRFIQDAWTGIDFSDEKIYMADVYYLDDERLLLWKRRKGTKEEKTFYDTVANVYVHVTRMHNLKAPESHYFRHDSGTLGRYTIENPDESIKLRRAWSESNSKSFEKVGMMCKVKWTCNKCGATYERTVIRQIELKDNMKCDNCLTTENEQKLVSVLSNIRKDLVTTEQEIKITRACLQEDDKSRFGDTQITKLTLFDICVNLGDFGDLIVKLFTGVIDYEKEKTVSIYEVNCHKRGKLYWLQDNMECVRRTPYHQIEWMIKHIIGVTDPVFEYGRDLYEYAEKFSVMKADVENGSAVITNVNMRVEQWCLEHPALAIILLGEWTGVASTGGNGWLVHIWDISYRSTRALYWRNNNNEFVLQSLRSRIEKLENGDIDLPDKTVTFPSDLYKFLTKGEAEAKEVLNKVLKNNPETSIEKIEDKTKNYDKTLKNNGEAAFTDIDNNVAYILELSGWCLNNIKLAKILLDEWTGVRDREVAAGWYANITNLGSQSFVKVYWRRPDGGFVIKTIKQRVDELMSGRLELTGDSASMNYVQAKCMKRGMAKAEEIKEQIRKYEVEQEEIKMNGTINMSAVTERKSFYDSEVKTDNSMFNWSGQNPEIGIQFMLEWTWLDENGQTVSPYDEAFDSERLVRWKDKDGHEWLESCANRTKYKSICPYCNKTHDECKKGQFPV